MFTNGSYKYNMSQYSQNTRVPWKTVALRADLATKQKCTIMMKEANVGKEGDFFDPQFV